MYILKAFADNTINVTEKKKYAFGKVENIAVKRENAGLQHFFLSPKYFRVPAFFLSAFKRWDCIQVIKC